MTCPSCQTDNPESASVCATCGADLSPTSVVVTVDLKPGALFHSRYEILGPLGRGGMGMVYKARDRSLDEVVAIKVLRPDFAQDPRMAERFKTEIRLARKVRHRNVCTIHDYGEDRGLLYISMEMIEGVDMKQVLRKQGGLPPEEAYDVAIQVAEGLQAVHEAGIIHRDLKTPNIMRDAQGFARLMDFGIAKREGEGTLTATGNIVGTPEYMSPEQAQGGRNVGFRSDVYALGIVIYEIFTGQVPFKGDTPISTILKHLNDPPPLDGEAAARLPRDLRPVLRRCLAKEAAERYASAREVADALREARSPSRRQQPIATEVLQAPTLRRSRRRGNRRVALQTFLLAVPAVAVAGGILIFRQSARERTAPAAAVTPSLPAAPTLAAALPAPTLLPSPSSAPAPTDSMPSAGRTSLAVPPVSAPAKPASPRATPILPAAHSSSPPVAAAAIKKTTSPGAAPAASAAPVGQVPATPAPAETVPSVAPTTAPPRADPPPPADPGNLQVVVRPWGEVSIDGRVVGTTPLDRISLSAGVHLVKARHPAYEVLERSVTIRAGQTERLVIDFTSQGTRKP